MAHCVFNDEPLQMPTAESAIGTSAYPEAQQILLLRRSVFLAGETEWVAKEEFFTFSVDI